MNQTKAKNKSSSTKSPAPTTKSTKPERRTVAQYEQLASDQLDHQIEFDVRAKGTNARLIGVLVALIPAGKTLAEARVRTTQAALLEGFSDCDKRRLRADVLVVRTNDPESAGKVRFFTPRPQQAVW